MNKHYDILILGGGAAGFFTAINTAEMLPNKRIAILERGKEVLTKVKVSGGGRCNVTHAEFIPSDLILKYPRGEKELLGPFHQFMTGDTMEWFESRGVPLKIEEDGRVFPTSDSSQTIIDCFLEETHRLDIDVLRGHSVKTISASPEGFTVSTSNGEFHSSKLVVATGSNPKIWSLLGKMGHAIVPPVPSLFTFNIKDPRIEGLAGLSTLVTTQIHLDGKAIDLASEGPLLITHWGMSGPAILKLSAWGARMLATTQYKFKLEVNWLENQSFEEVITELRLFRSSIGKKIIAKNTQFGLPKRLWESLVLHSGISSEKTWADITKEELRSLAQNLTASLFKVDGKSTFKEEFVTAGGIDLKQINFKSFESKIIPGMYLAGEILNIDAITGGFNFQNAWTGGFLIAADLAKTFTA